MKGFSKALLEHERAMRSKATERGLAHTVQHFSPEHFEWLALFQCGNHSLDYIKNHHAKTVADKTSISKGMHHAARLAGGIAIRSTRGKLKSSYFPT
jgi:hypothetical protein